MGFVSSLLALFGLPVAALLCGSVLLWAGWRGRRVGNHSTCRRCGYDLTGRPEGSNACPECGSDLTRPRAVAVGDWSRKPKLAALGAAAVMVGGLRLAGDVRRTIGDDVNTLKPAWWLAREAQTGDRPHRQAALTALRHRLPLGQVSAATVKRLTASALDRQADLSKPWEAEWGEWLEAALAAGKLTDAERDRYFRQAVAPCYVGLKVRQRVRRGDPFPVTRIGENGPRLAGQQGYFLGRGPDLRFDDRIKYRPTDRDSPYMLTGPGFVLSPATVPYETLSDGRHSIVLLGAIGVSARGQKPVDVPYRLEAEWELLPADSPSVELVDAPELRGQIEPQVWVGVKVEPFRGGAGLASVSIIFNRLPVGVAYDVVLRAGEKEWAAGPVSAPAGSYAQRATRPEFFSGFDAEKVDVVLRPNPDAAESTLDVLRIWNHEIVKQDVPVTRTPPRRPPPRFVPPS